MVQTTFTKTVTHTATVVASFGNVTFVELSTNDTRTSDSPKWKLVATDTLTDYDSVKAAPFFDALTVEEREALNVTPTHRFEHKHSSLEDAVRVMENGGVAVRFDHSTLVIYDTDDNPIRLPVLHAFSWYDEERHEEVAVHLSENPQVLNIVEQPPKRWHEDDTSSFEVTFLPTEDQFARWTANKGSYSPMGAGMKINDEDALGLNQFRSDQD